MLNSLVEHVKLSAGAVVTKTVGQVVVGVMFVIAAAFAVAAVAVWLIQNLGAIAAYAILAAVFALLGVVVAAFISVQRRHQERLLREAKANRSAMISSMAAVNPLAFAGALKALGRRTPMALVLLVLGGVLLGRSTSTAKTNAHNSAHKDSHAAAG
jgi:tagatose-1,6-bisphosphate aldolase non-catalytic subunit AgaZ/GatZ